MSRAGARVAFLTAGCMLPGHPERRVDHWEHDREFDPMRAACAARDIDLRTEVWDDPTLDVETFDAVVIGTTWDYTERPEQFLATLERFASKRPLFNPLEIVRWNANKTYLRDLVASGAPVVPTLWRSRADAVTIGRAFDELGVEEIVVKPVIGASAWRQARLRRRGTLPPPAELPPGDALIQPFLPAASTEGEYSFLFFDRAFSHCARKVPEAGDYRVQSAYGGREVAHMPSADDLTLARRVLDAVKGPLLYARVDMMRGLDGQLAVMELELVEPYLYPDQAADLGGAFAAALERQLTLARSAE